MDKRTLTMNELSKEFAESKMSFLDFLTYKIDEIGIEPVQAAFLGIGKEELQVAILDVTQDYININQESEKNSLAKPNAHEEKIK